jgi:N-terminal half of MaoC dehydratase
VSYEVPIEYGKVREFARAVKSDQPEHASRDGVVPPTFLQTARLAWEPPGEGAVAAHGFDPKRVLHGEEEFVFLGPPPAVGTVLQATTRAGARYEKPARGGGVMRFAETVVEFRDASGDLVAEQHTTVIETPKREDS